MKKLLSTLFQPLKAVSGAIVLRCAQRRDRDAFMQLVWQEDRILSDVGYTRDDINWAVNLPIHMNAAQELDKQVRGAKATGELHVQESHKHLERQKQPCMPARNHQAQSGAIADSSVDSLACCG